MGVSDLLTMAEAAALRAGKPNPKPAPHQIAKKAKKKSKDEQAKAFRDEVWRLDGGKCRATGKPLSRSGVDWDAIGEVDHSIPRSLAPERLYDVSNGLLLTKTLNRLRKVACTDAPEYRVFDYSGPDNRRLPQTFVWRDMTGKITKTRMG
jgi:5-methylcytosine-specific restriction endonuclease McrA